MTTHKTAELIGIDLDAAVALAAGYELLPPLDGHCCIKGGGARFDSVAEFQPSTEWWQGGPIIEREGIGISMVRQGEWLGDPPWTANYTGPTPLIAAMRAYVGSKFGEKVDLP